MKDFKVKVLCILALLQPFVSLYSVTRECLDSVATSGHYLHSHLFTGQCKRCLPDLDVHAFGTLLSSQTVYGFCQYYIYSKLEIVPLFFA